MVGVRNQLIGERSDDGHRDHRRTDAELAQGAFLLDDPAFLKEIVQRVVQELLEAEMTEHLGAAPYERNATRTGQRNGH
jgi:transposase-like protein